MLKPIRDPRQIIKGDLAKVPPLFIGGAVFNQQFNASPESLPIRQILTTAFENGLNAIDTSPYYGPSEILLGKALESIAHDWPRETYFLVTKCGRVRLDEFDYSASWIRTSVERSLQRLHTEYLDLVYLHDIEFVEESKILEALTELRRLKDEGVIKNFGLSGYPVDFLYKIASKVVNIPSIGPLDAALSYSNFNLQNDRLRPFIPKFYQDAHLQKLLNGSILSMSLLRSGPTHEFHPASKELRAKCDEIAQLTASHGVELADLATRFAIREFLPYGSIVLGVSNVEELENAIVQYWNVKDNKIDDTELVTKVHEAFGVHLNEVWESGIQH